MRMIIAAVAAMLCAGSAIACPVFGPNQLGPALNEIGLTDLDISFSGVEHLRIEGPVVVCPAGTVTNLSNQTFGVVGFHGFGRMYSVAHNAGPSTAKFKSSDREPVIQALSLGARQDITAMLNEMGLKGTPVWTVELVRSMHLRLGWVLEFRLKAEVRNPSGELIATTLSWAFFDSTTPGRVVRVTVDPVVAKPDRPNAAAVMADLLARIGWQGRGEQVSALQ